MFQDFAGVPVVALIEIQVKRAGQPVYALSGETRPGTACVAFGSHKKAGSQRIEGSGMAVTGHWMVDVG